MTDSEAIVFQFVGRLFHLRLLKNTTTRTDEEFLIIRKMEAAKLIDSFMGRLLDIYHDKDDDVTELVNQQLEIIAEDKSEAKTGLAVVSLRHLLFKI